MTTYKCGLKKEDFQKEVDGKKTDLFILVNKNGCEVAITNYGGAIAAIMVPDKDGNFANVAQGHDNIDSVIKSPEAFLSTLVGRYGNRIKKGIFKLEGKEYTLKLNAEENHMHGGPTGYHKRVWDAKQTNDHELVLTYVSPDGEEGYPGTVTLEVTFTFDDENALKIDYKGTTDKTTVLNMTHHLFLNLHGLVGEMAPVITDHVLTLNSKLWLPTDPTKIPTGELADVKGTPFDFLEPHTIGERIDADHIGIKIGAGYDHCFVVNQEHPGELTKIVNCVDPESKRLVEVFTTEPGLQIYTANWHSGFPAYHGCKLPRRSGVAFEAQKFPDTPNIGHFPTCVVRPGETYTQTTIYKFGIAQ